MKKFLIDWTGNSIKYNKREKNAVNYAMENAEPFTQGKYLYKFEKSFSKYIGSNSGAAYAVSNCSNALDISAILINTNIEDEIIMPAHTWCATAISFARFGAKIKWADIDSDTFLISLESIKKLVTKRTKAIVVVHLYGLPAEINEIALYAKEKNIILIEDCAQSLGASVNNKKTGSFGDISVFSFHSNKIITTLGEGGVILVKNKKFDKKVRALLHNGVEPYKRKDPKLYWKPSMNNIINAKKNFWPYNFCIGEIQCALGIELIDRIDSLNKIRIFRAQKFINSLKKYEELKFQKTRKGYKNVYHCLVAKYCGKNSKIKRDYFMKLMSEKFRVKTIVQNRPLNRFKLFKNFKVDNVLKNTNNFFDNMISWPFYTYMSKSKFDYMIKKTKIALDIVRKKYEI